MTTRFTWTTKTPPGGFTTRLRDIAYTSNGSLGKYCAVGESGSVITSSDGDTWVEQTSGYTGNYFLSITTDNSIWVAAGGDEDTGTTPVIYTSSDGVSWTSRTIPFNSRYFYSVVWTGTNFVAAGSEGKVATSPDGTTWTERTITGNNGQVFIKMIYSGSRLVVVGTDGDMWYSDNHGVAWTASGDLLSSKDHGGLFVTWNGSYFVAMSVYSSYGHSVYASNYPNDILTSSDGISWVDDPFDKQDIRPPRFYIIGADGSGETMICANQGYTYVGTGSSGSIEWEERARFTTGSEWPRGIIHDGTDYWLVGDNAIIAKGEYSTVTAATNPSPAHVSYGLRGTNVTSTTAQLSWTGIGSGTHEVFLGTDPSSLASQGNIGVAETFDPGTLTANDMYWWRVDIIDGATTYTGDVWHFVTEPSSAPSTEKASTLSSVAYLDSETQHGSGTWAAVTAVSPIHGHRYFMMASGRYYSEPRGFVGSFVNDEDLQYDRATVNRPYLGGQFYHIQRHFCNVYQCMAGDTFSHKVRKSTGSNNVYIHQHYLVGIDLDSPSMEEGADWFYERVVDEALDSTSWTGDVGASLTFTPDGYSDYLAFMHFNLAPTVSANITYNHSYGIRLRDTTNNNVLVQTGSRNNSSTYDYEHSFVGFKPLVSMPNEPLNLKVEAYQNNNPNDWKIRSTSIFVLRLSKFEGAVTDSQLDIGFTDDALTEIQSEMTFNADDLGEGIFMFHTQTPRLGTSEGQYSVATSLQVDGSVTADTEYYSGRGQDLSRSDLVSMKVGESDSAVSSFAVRKLTGLTAGARTVRTYVAGERTDYVSVSDLDVVAFSPKFATAPVVKNLDPFDGEGLVSLQDPISMVIMGEQGVDLSTINIDVSFSDEWVQYGTADATHVRAIGYSGSAFVTVGSSGKINWSSDGRGWTSVTSGTAQDLRSVAYGAGIWVVVGVGGVLLTSSDGLSWTDRSLSTGGNSLQHVKFIGGQFVTVGGGGNIWTSSNGTSWTSRGSESANFESVGYNGSDLYCVVGSSGTIITSADAITWTTRTSGTSSTIKFIDHDQTTRWVATLNNEDTMLTSTNGTSWSSFDTITGLETYFIQASTDKWVAGGGSGVILASPDGLNWYRTNHRMTSTCNIPLFANGTWYIPCNNGFVLESSYGGFNHNYTSAVEDGELGASFDNTNSSIVSILDGYGYNVVLSPYFALTKKAQIVHVTVDASSLDGSVMPTLNYRFSWVNGRLDIVRFFDGPYSKYSGGQTVVLDTFYAGSGRDLLPHHRYFLLMSSPIRNEYSGYIDHRVYINDVHQGDLRMLQRGPEDNVSYGKVRQFEPDDVIRLESTLGATSGESVRFGPYSLLFIDLDSDPNTFAENDNWFYNLNTSYMSAMNNTWTDNVGAQITFTPDGTSDYLIIATPMIYGNNAGWKTLKMRAYDSILGELTQAGHRLDSNNWMRFGRALIYMLSAPPATERTVSVQLLGDGVFNHEQSNILIVKMDSFKKKSFSQSITPVSGFGTTVSSVTTTDFAADGYGDVNILCMLEGYDSFRMNIDIDGSNLLFAPGYSESNRFDLDYPTYHRLNAIGVYNHSGLWPGQSYEVEFLTAAGSTSNTLYKHNLIAFGTELFVPPPTQVINPSPASGTNEVVLTTLLGWDAGNYTTGYALYFSTSPTITPADFVGSYEGTTGDPPGAFLDINTTYYWRIDSVGDGGTTEGTVWNFTTVETYPTPNKATNEDPTDDEIDVSVDKVLSWTSGTSQDPIIPVTHDVYFGTDFNLVNTDSTGDTTFRGNQSGSTFNPSNIPMNSKTYKLDSDTDYYWRVDERNVGGVTKGDVWHFKTEYVAPPLKAVFPDPGNTQTQVIPDVNLVWTQGARTVVNDVYFGTDTNPSGNFVVTTSTPVYDPPGDMDLNRNYYWRVDSIGTGGTTTGDVWQFQTLTALPYPSKASSPSPADGATNVNPAANLSWASGTGIPYIGAISHNRYLSTNPDPSDGSYGNSASTGFSPGVLIYSTTYYWRIDEVRAIDGAVLEGDVWSFTTSPIYARVPRNGDKVYNVIQVDGTTDPNVGVHAEALVSGVGLIGDGYTTTDENGDFFLVCPFTKQSPGTPITLAMVTQASPDSEEVIINLVQSREPIGDPIVRVGRRVNADQNTVAIWRLDGSRKVNIEHNTFRSENFITAGPTSVPERPDTPGFFSRQGTYEAFYPRFQNGFMTTYNFSTSGIYSRLYDGSAAGQRFEIDDGGIYRFAWRTAKGSEYSPSESTQTLVTMGDIDTGRGCRVDYDISSGLHLDAVTNRVVTDSSATIDKYNWNEIEIRTINTIPGDDDSAYVELYVNGQLYNSAFSGSGLPTAFYLGAVYSSNFTTSDFGYFAEHHTNPFIALPGYNAQGDKTRDGQINSGVAPVIEYGDVPSDYVTQLNGTGGYITSDHSAFDLAGVFTAEGWFKLDTGSVGTERVFFGKQSRNASGWALRLGAEGKIWGYTYNGTAQLVDTGFYPLEDTWYHLVFIWDGTRVRIYINGQRKSYQAVGYTANTAQPFRVGSYSDAAEGLFKGRVFDVRVSDTIRSSWEIYRTYNAVSDPQSGLPQDIFTLASLNFCYDDGILYAKSSRTETFKSIDFTTGNIGNFFEIASFSGDGSASLTVSGGVPTLEINHVTGNDTNVVVSSAGKLRLHDNFDFQTTYDTTKSILCPISTGVLHEVSSDRVVREGSVWYNGDLGSTSKYVRTDEDGYINYTHYIASGTGTQSVSKTFDFSVTGYDYETTDGYLVYDIHGGRPLGAHYFRMCPVGNWARDFDGSTTAVKISDHQDWDHRDLSVEVWFSADALQEGCLVSRNQSGTNAYFIMQVNSDGSLTVGVGDDGGTDVTVTSGTYTVGAWHYAAMTFDNSEGLLALYLDGRLIKTGTISSGSGTYISNLPVYIGCINNQSEYFNGAIASVRFSCVPRTPKQIFDMFHGSDVKEGR